MTSLQKKDPPQGMRRAGSDTEDFGNRSDDKYSRVALWSQCCSHGARPELPVCPRYFSATDINLIFDAVVNSPSVSEPKDADAAKQVLGQDLETAWVSYCAPETRLTSSTMAKKTRALLWQISRQSEALLKLLNTCHPDMHVALAGLFPPLLKIGDPSEYADAQKPDAPSLAVLKSGLEQLADVSILRAQYTGETQAWPSLSKQNLLYLQLGSAYRETFCIEPRQSANGPFGKFLKAVFDAQGKVREASAHIGEYRRAAG